MYLTCFVLSHMNIYNNKHIKTSSTTFDPELRNEFKIFSNPGGSIPQLLILNSEMNLNFFPILGGPFHNSESLNSEMNLKIFPILVGGGLS